MVLALFVAVAVLKNFETFDATIHVLDEDSVFGHVAIEPPLQFRQRVFLRALERRQTENVKFAKPLITLVSDQKNVR
jgi:hypothetical protein